MTKTVCEAQFNEVIFSHKKYVQAIICKNFGQDNTFFFYFKAPATLKTISTKKVGIWCTVFDEGNIHAPKYDQYFLCVFQV